MSIQFKNTVVHSLPEGMDQPLLSNAVATLTDETEALITSAIMQVLDSVNLKEGIFQEQLTLEGTIETIPQLIQHIDQVDFIDASQKICERLFAMMLDDTHIVEGDLIITRFNKENVNYLGIIKWNYKKEYRHMMDNEQLTIIRDTATYSLKIKEAALINLDKQQVMFIDTSRSRYMVELLRVMPSLSKKEQEKVVSYVIQEIIEEHYDNKLEAIAFAKGNIYKSMDATKEIKITEVLEETFGDNEELIQQAKDKMEKYGVTADVPVTYKQLAKYKKHKLKTNTGIEISLPIELLTDPNVFEVLTNPDGSQNVVVKNIACLRNK